MNESPQEATLPPEGNAIKQAVDWAAKHWARVRLAHEGMMLEKIQRQNRIVEVDARNAMTGKVDDVADWPSSEGNEMGVDIGDTIHNHYSIPSSQPKSRLPSILKVAALATALVGSGGIGAAIPWCLGMFDETSPPPAVEHSDRWMERTLENYVPPQGQPDEPIGEQ